MNSSFDVFFISSYELNAEKNWNNLKKIFPQAKRIHGLSSILEAYSMAAKASSTEFFFTVDGDNFIFSDFSFTNVDTLVENKECVHVWRSQNAVNGLIYGFGGVKLWPKINFDLFLPEESKKFVDITTAIARGKYYIQNQLASETIFNTSPFHAWKGAFRECSKLSSAITSIPNETTQKRLDTWTSRGSDKPFGLWCIEGARMGQEFGKMYYNNPDKILLINNNDYLNVLFASKFKESI